jgi:AcrR family transcriptional regulator
MRTKGAAHAETRAQIIDAARDLVLRDGHARLSLRAVARAMGLSAPTLYEYFDSKQAIVDAIAAQVAAKLRYALQRAIKDTTSERKAIIALGLEYVAWARRHPQDFMLMFARLSSKRRSLRQTVPEESPYQILLSAVTAARNAEIVRGDPDRVAYALWATAHGMAMLQLTHLAGFDADFDATDRATFEALVDGFSPR